MELRNNSDCISGSAIVFWDRNQEIEAIPWNEHPSFSGVFLKHLIKGIDTEGSLSCHMVKIDPHCILEEHVHESQWEVHEVIQGAGLFLLGSREAQYYPGQVAVIPKGTTHKVVALGEGLVLLASFSPALV
jgi:quercetin dioxygenase-like cupin family protein